MYDQTGPASRHPSQVGQLATNISSEIKNRHTFQIEPILYLVKFLVFRRLDSGVVWQDLAMNFYRGLGFTSFDYLYGSSKARSGRYVIKYYDSGRSVRYVCSILQSFTQKKKIQEQMAD